jgi:hypothetical protein
VVADQAEVLPALGLAVTQIQAVQAAAMEAVAAHGRTFTVLMASMALEPVAQFASSGVLTAHSLQLVQLMYRAVAALLV